eukprot:CAMPEP_0179285652 /NCGR_PEP_ID=MMETSP0797-20121207/39323_1 /TAXON_ID=47934 /ORGANISM="Dinophysis acuminata, Strain DAEP01" /LENGTH=54 /DNA_ID=CAMNT_0020994485 /DNA_START=144 /DNA_END=305 /DNA_ORIENTATION=+
MSTLAWAVAARSMRHPPLLEAISAAALKPCAAARELTTQTRANTAWAFAKRIVP